MSKAIVKSSVLRAKCISTLKSIKLRESIEPGFMENRAAMSVWKTCRSLIALADLSETVEVDKDDAYWLEFMDSIVIDEDR